LEKVVSTLWSAANDYMDPNYTDLYLAPATKKAAGDYFTKWYFHQKAAPMVFVP
jgi:hypothetical protein